MLVWLGAERWAKSREAVLLAKLVPKVATQKGYGRRVLRADGVREAGLTCAA